METMENNLEEKCNGVNLVKGLLLKDNSSNPQYSEMLEIINKSYDSLKIRIDGPYRFGCI